MKRLSILGSTGSVGEQTLAVVEAFPDRFRASALAAGHNTEKLCEQIERFAPERVSVADPEAAEALKSRFGDRVAVGSGAAGIEAVAVHPADLVVAAVVGAAGLRPTLAAVQAGRDIALANKEALVMAGALVRRAVAAHGVALLPVDSEHSAIFQALAGQRMQDVARVILTCSGGPFRTWSESQIQAATRDQALKHPNWDMGAKITIDSATLMNKGLEVIEARWLFDVSPEQIDVVVHPESIVHSLVEFCDSSVLAQLGLPDMRVPIAVALAHPERLDIDLPRLDLASIGRLEFEPPDRKRFPCLDLAFRALRGSEAAPAVLNAANEVSVAAFLREDVAFPAIAATNAAVLEEHLSSHAGARVESLEEVMAADEWARECAQALLASAPAPEGVS